MTIRLSALFENKVDELLLNFYRNRAGSARRTRSRSRQAVEEQPGPSGMSNQRRTVTPRARPELVPRSSTRASNRRNHDGAGPSSGGTESLRMRISLTRGSVLSTTGLGDVEGIGGSSSRSEGASYSSNSSSSRYRAGDIPEEGSTQRTRTRSRTSYGESLNSTSSNTCDTSADTERRQASLNGPSTRYSTRSRAPLTRHIEEVNGVSESADHDSEDYEEDSGESDEESSEASESGFPQERKTLKSSRSGKAPVSRKAVSKRTSSQKGKRVVRRRRSSVSENEEPVRSSRRSGLRTRVSRRYDESASESDVDPSVNELLDVSSRGRVRRKASRMMDYVN